MRLDKFWFCFGDEPKQLRYYDAETCTKGEITDLDKMSDFVLENADREIRDFFVRFDSSTLCVTLKEKEE